MTREEAYLKALELYDKTHGGAIKSGAFFANPKYQQILEIANWLIGEDNETEENDEQATD